MDAFISAFVSAFIGANIGWWGCTGILWVIDLRRKKKQEASHA